MTLGNKNKNISVYKIRHSVEVFSHVSIKRLRGKEMSKQMKENPQNLFIFWVIHVFMLPQIFLLLFASAFK